VDLLVLYDHQELAANRWSLTNVLMAAPGSQSADIPLTAVIASLASLRQPEDLGLVLISRPQMLPDEIGRLPHALLPPVDASDAEAVHEALDSVRSELNRRVAQVTEGEPDIVLVVRELADLDAEALGRLHAIVGTGPNHHVRVVAASERPVADLRERCSFLDEFGTRLVLQVRDEDESVALLGMPSAEELGQGGHALLRFESRVPVQGWARQVPADHLARLASLMGTRASAPFPEAVEPEDPDPCDLSLSSSTRRTGAYGRQEARAYSRRWRLAG
jgi:DNA segregation ATPase FtsK/SpoIIIE-like protein